MNTPYRRAALLPRLALILGLISFTPVFDAPASALASSSEAGPLQAQADCPGADDLYDLLRGLRASGELVTEVDRSALADSFPRFGTLEGFWDKAWNQISQFAAGFFADTPPEWLDSEGDSLGWLLTESATPRYPENPYVQLTRDRLPSLAGRSYETALAERIALSDGNLSPSQVMQMALEETGYDYPLAALTAHNLLKELTYANRQGGPALVGWNRQDRGGYAEAIGGLHRGYETLDSNRVAGVIDKLANLRAIGDPHAGDKMGPWYHLYGVLFVGSVTSRHEADFGAFMENFTRWLRLGSSRDEFKEQMNDCYSDLTGRIADIDAAMASEAPVSAEPVESPPVPAPPQPIPVPSPARPAVTPTPAPQYHVFVLQGIGFYVGTEQEVRTKRSCNYRGGGLCPAASGPAVVMGRYSGPFPSVQAAKDNLKTRLECRTGYWGPQAQWGSGGSGLAAGGWHWLQNNVTTSDCKTLARS
jgi:hypothetical protein